MAEGGPTLRLADRHVLLGVTGGIAAYKAVHLARLLVSSGSSVQVVMTPGATRFIGPATFAAVTRRPVHSDVFERPESVLHVTLGKEADVAVIAPATANVIARLAFGLADDLLTAALLEARCPLVLAPAMHAGMWGHPATRRNLETLGGRGAIVVGPAEGPLAAGDEGMGRMAEPEEILVAVAGVAARDLAGVRMLVTAGPTHEPLDAVRFLGNRSSGKMGFAVATEAARRGADVTLVSGPVELGNPPAVRVVRVETTEEMRERVLERFPSVDAVVMAAAVSDFRPREVARGKHKKAEGIPEVLLEPTRDILAELGKLKERQFLVGFAAETDDVVGEGRRKLVTKNVDLVVANVVGEPGTGFGADTNQAAIISSGGDDQPVREWTKPDLAAAICDRVVEALRGAPRAGNARPI